MNDALCWVRLNGQPPARAVRVHVQPPCQGVAPVVSDLLFAAMQVLPVPTRPAARDASRFYLALDEGGFGNRQATPLDNRLELKAFPPLTQFVLVNAVVESDSQDGQALQHHISLWSPPSPAARTAAMARDSPAGFEKRLGADYSDSQHGAAAASPVALYRAGMLTALDASRWPPAAASVTRHSNRHPTQRHATAATHHHDATVETSRTMAATHIHNARVATTQARTAMRPTTPPRMRAGAAVRPVSPVRPSSRGADRPAFGRQPAHLTSAVPSSWSAASVASATTAPHDRWTPPSQVSTNHQDAHFSTSRIDRRMGTAADARQAELARAGFVMRTPAAAEPLPDTDAGWYQFHHDESAADSDATSPHENGVLAESNNIGSPFQFRGSRRVAGGGDDRHEVASAPRPKNPIDASPQNTAVSVMRARESRFARASSDEGVPRPLIVEQQSARRRRGQRTSNAATRCFTIAAVRICISTYVESVGDLLAMASCCRSLREWYLALSIDLAERTLLCDAALKAMRRVPCEAFFCAVSGKLYDDELGGSRSPGSDVGDGGGVMDVNTFRVVKLIAELVTGDTVLNVSGARSALVGFGNRAAYMRVVNALAKVAEVEARTPGAVVSESQRWSFTSIISKVEPAVLPLALQPAFEYLATLLDCASSDRWSIVERRLCRKVLQLAQTTVPATDNALNRY